MKKYTINLRESYPLWSLAKCKDPNAVNPVEYQLFTASPFLQGEATTIGVALRRVLLANVKGFAITSVKFVGIDHEYTCLEGIKESVHDILINIQQIVVILDHQVSNDSLTGSINITGPKTIIAADIKLSEGAKIVNPSQFIANVNKPVTVNIELIIEKGIGFTLKEDIKPPEGYFAINAFFNPVRKVNFSIHDLSDSQEALLLEVWTNGAISPVDALSEASEYLIHYFLPLLRIKETIPNSLTDNVDTKLSYTETSQTNKAINNNDKSNIKKSHIPSNNLSKPLSDKINKPISFYKTLSIKNLELSTRPAKCLAQANILTIYDLLQFTQEDLLKIKNMGPSSVKEIVYALQKCFGINLRLKNT